MKDRQRYYSFEALRGMPLAKLRVLWEQVPTDRQRSYRQAYEREVLAAGAEGSDVKEKQVAVALLQRYVEAALVPIGLRWARTPGRVQEAARKGENVDAPEDEAGKNRNKPSPVILLGLGLAALAMVGMVLLRGGLFFDGETAATDDVEMITTGRTVETPTPLALEAQDDVIQGGDASRATMYPINLQIAVPGSPQPRVWVMQQRTVRASQWHYDPNPDTASFLSGMAIRPVIGIPWSEDNAEWFERIGEGSSFNLQMNTGAILHFEFMEKREVRRSDTGIFRQISPGVVLLLLGETDEEGLPTATRTMVTAWYPPEQELSRSGELLGALALPTPHVTPTAPLTLTPTPVVFPSFGVQVIEVTYATGQLTTVLRIYNGSSQIVPVKPDDLWLALGYIPQPSGPRVPADGLTAFDLLPGQAADVTLLWRWEGEPYAVLGIGEWRFAINVT